MKRLLADLALAFVIGLAALMLGACASSPGGAPVVAVQTFNDKLALTEHALQLAQTSATALMRAGSITVDRDAKIQAQLEVAHKGLVTAKAVQSSDPAKAAASLNDALVILDQLGVLKPPPATPGTSGVPK